MTYASVEAFRQGLKFPAEADRLRIAQLYGLEARAAGAGTAYEETLLFNGVPVRTGTYEHWSLMERACEAKFTQHTEARTALLATGTRPLVHRTRRDGRTIPGVVMAENWMRIRARLVRRQGGLVEQEPA